MVFRKLYALGGWASSVGVTLARLCPWRCSGTLRACSPTPAPPSLSPTPHNRLPKTPLPDLTTGKGPGEGHWFAHHHVEVASCGWEVSRTQGFQPDRATPAPQLSPSMDHGAGLLLFNNMSMKEYSVSHSDANDSQNGVSTPDSAVFATEATPTAHLGYRGQGLDLGTAGGCPLGLILQIRAELGSPPPAPLLEIVFHSSTRIKVSECRDPWGSGLPGSRCPSVRERASAGPSETQGHPPHCHCSYRAAKWFLVPSPK